MAEETKDIRVTILMAPSELKEVDDWSFEQRIRSRGEAIRRLLRVGIAAEPILRDLLRLIEHLNDPELAKHEKAIREALGE